MEIDVTFTKRILQEIKSYYQRHISLVGAEMLVMFSTLSVESIEA